MEARQSGGKPAEPVPVTRFLEGGVVPNDVSARVVEMQGLARQAHGGCTAEVDALTEVVMCSEPNIGRMIAFYREYSSGNPILPRAVAKSPRARNGYPSAGRIIADENLPQPVAELGPGRRFSDQSPPTDLKKSMTQSTVVGSSNTAPAAMKGFQAGPSKFEEGT